MKCGVDIVTDKGQMVTTRAVVWIEITFSPRHRCNTVSPPVRWCGLKFGQTKTVDNGYEVTTRAVVWIEIITPESLRK